MAIHRLLGAGSFGPDQTAMIVAAYDRAVEELHLKPDRYAPANEVVATKVIDTVITSSPDLMPAAINARWRAEVPELRAMACLTRQ